MNLDDKQLEKDRYNNVYANSSQFEAEYMDSLPNYLKAPYVKFQSLLSETITNDMSILEVGTGSGIFSRDILMLCGEYLATDISQSSLELLREKLCSDPCYHKLKTQELDIECPDLPDQSFDVIVSCGSLSYGNNLLVLNNFKKLLKPNGVLLVVDSLDHNPIYRLNRFVHYLRGKRTFSTLQRMPTVQLISRYREEFTELEEHYYGVLAFAAPLLKFFVEVGRLDSILRRVDHKDRLKKHSFKFVLKARK